LSRTDRPAVKIFILKPSSLGDVVQALPLLRLLKRHLPDSQIYWWIESRLAPLLEGDPDLTGVLPFDRHGWMAKGSLTRLWRSLLWARRQSFDWVIDLQCLARSGTFAWLVNGQLTIGLDEPREGARGFYDVIVRRASFHTHAVDWYLSVLPALGVPVHWDFEWLPRRPVVAAALRHKWPVAHYRWIVLQPGARWSNKRWPAESFAALAHRLLAARPDCRCAILGGQDETPLGTIISRAAPERCLDLTGRLSLQEMVEWIRLSELMVTNDTGPMHVAAAVGTPVVALFGPTEPRRTGPYRQLHQSLQLNLPCVPCLRSRCHHVPTLECLHAMPVNTVLEAALQRLSPIR
jgi:heptosyltransferase I